MFDIKSCLFHKLFNSYIVCVNTMFTIKIFQGDFSLRDLLFELKGCYHLMYLMFDTDSLRDVVPSTGLHVVVLLFFFVFFV